MGGFDFDTACTKQNALATPVWFNRQCNRNALLVPWSGKSWCNPPYSDIDPWVEHALAQPALTALLVPSPNGETRYATLCRQAREYMIVGRISFIGAAGDPVDGNPRGSSLFLINAGSRGRRTVIERAAIWRAA